MKGKKALWVLFLVSLIVYANNLFAGFVWDDKPQVVDRQDFFSHPVNAFHLLASADTDSLNTKIPYYRPLNTLSYMLDHYLWGLNPFWYHLENILLHSMVVMLFYLLIMEAFKDWRLAFFSALLFSVYPANSEAVDAVFNRNTLLCAFFSLATLVFLMKGRKILPFLAYFLALLSKEPATVLPFFLVSFTLTSREEKFKVNSKVFYWFFGITAAYFLIRHLVLGTFIAKPGVEFSVERLKLIAAVYFEHFRLFVYPFKLNALYTEKTLSFSLPKAATAIAGILVLLYFSLRRKTPDPVRAGAQWIFWGLLPVSNVIKIPSAPVAERYQYTVLFGFALIIGYIAGQFFRRKAFWGVMSVTVLMLAFAVRTFERNFVWKDDVSLFSSMIQSEPENPLAHYNLGLAFEKSGEFDLAANEFKTAISVKPTLADARVDLGIIYAEEGHIGKAISEFKTALSSNPALVTARLNLGVAYAKEGRLNDAIGEFGVAVSLSPFMAEAHLDLGTGYEKKGLLEKASVEFKKALKLDPGNSAAIENLRRIEYQAGQ